MGLAMGILHWSPEEFWTSTPHDLLAALDGYRMANDPDYAGKKSFAEFKAQFEGE